MIGFPRRLLESALLPIMISVLCMLGRKAAIIPGAVIASGVCILAILVFNYINMTDHLFAIRREDVFYKTNFAVFGINFAFSMTMTVLAHFIEGMKDVYAFVCAPYQVLNFLNVPLFVSALIVNAIFAVEIFLMPYIAMKRRRQ